MKGKAAIRGFLAGAAVMYFADPGRGRRRRVVFRDRFAGVWHDLRREVNRADRDLRNRSKGIEATLRSSLPGREHARDTDSAVVAERARSQVGRAVSHPHAVRVRAESGGRLVLEGLVLEHEKEYLLKCMRSVRGVTEVIDRLDARPEHNNVPGLQGGRSRRERSEFRERWTPAMRIGAGAISGLGILYTAKAKGGIVRTAAIAANAVLLARAVANRSVGEMLGVSPGSRGVHIDKAVHIAAPVEEVFGFWSNLSNLPKFMTHLKEVRDLGNGRTHWIAAGPGGVSIPWDAEITEFRKDELLAWRSVPGAQIGSAGVVRFDREPDGGTRITVRMSYWPPAGLIGHGLAVLIGLDPKSELNDDLARFKTLIELGKTHAHHTAVSREQLGVGSDRR